MFYRDSILNEFNDCQKFRRELNWTVSKDFYDHLAMGKLSDALCHAQILGWVGSS